MCDVEQGFNSIVASFMSTGEPGCTLSCAPGVLNPHPLPPMREHCCMVGCFGEGSQSFAFLLFYFN